MARYQQKLIKINNVPADVVTHRVYYDEAGPPDYTATFVEFPEAVNPITMPDDLPDVMGKPQFWVGVSAINDQGHESDMGSYPDPFGFVAPPVPEFTISDA